MNCPAEMTWSIYADGELPAEEVRSLETHLVSCRDCRNRVMALRDEAAALANAMTERVPDRIPVRDREAPAPELAWELPAAIAAVTAVLTIVGILIELRLPGVLDLLNPRRLIGVYEMSFDTLFMLRERLPALFDTIASVGAMAAFSALGCAALHALSRRLGRSSSSLSLLLVLVLFTPGISRALDVRYEQDTHIGAGQTLAETLFCTGELVTIDGTVDGDVVVAAERFSLRGTITGNLVVLGSEIDLAGTIHGSLIGAGESVNLGGRVDGSVTLAGDRLTILDAASLGGDVTLFAEGARISGVVGRDVTFAGEWLDVRGDIGRDLQLLGADRIALLDGARIAGDVRGTVWGTLPEIEEMPGASVGGKIDVTQRAPMHDGMLARYSDVGFYVVLLVAAAAAFVYGLFLYLVDPRLFEAESLDGRGFLRALGIGFVVCLAGPVAVILIGLTVVGLPIAVLGAFALVTAIYTAHVVVAASIGQWVVPPSGRGLGAFAPSLLTGVLILGIATALPFVGPAVHILAVLFGLGCLLERVRGLHAINLRGIRG